MIGFAVLNSGTYALDLTLLSVLRYGVGAPLWLALTVGYGVAFTLAFLLNRWLNFRAHGDVGRQTGLYVAVVAINFLVILQGVTNGLAYFGVQDLVARLVAGACEGVFMYCALRWVVFARAGRPAADHLAADHPAADLADPADAEVRHP